MPIVYCSHKEFLQRLRYSPLDLSAVGEPAAEAVVVDYINCRDEPSLPAGLRLPACPVLGVNMPHQSALYNPPDSRAEFPCVDAIAGTPDELELLLDGIETAPRAAAVLAQLLRQSLSLTASQALIAESLAYSTLQQGEEFKCFLATHSRRASLESVAPAVLVERHGDVLHLMLNRPEKRNAYSAAMRDALCEALQVATLDATVRRIKLSGSGPTFCAGGDLNEFGEARDAAVAHLSRSSLSAAALLYGLSDRVEVDVQGACVGAGIELPAFAGTIRAAEDAFFQLPELSLGLVPGAGGTVSLPRRIGRLRTMSMALSGTPIDLDRALDWGLVDHRTNALAG